MSTLVENNGFLPNTSFFDDFLTRDLFDWSNRRSNQFRSVPPVNIIVTNDDFRVEMAAPGMQKNDFHVELDNDMLTIWTELNAREESENQKFTRREFSYHSFKRSFYLPNTVEANKIEATYKNGMLYLVIPKKEEARKKPVKTIAIS